MAPGLPNYTKLNGGGGGGGGGGGSGVYGAVGVGGIPPSPPPAEKVRSSPTLFQMMSHDNQVVDLHPQQHQLMPPPAAAPMPFPVHIIQQQHQLLQVQQQHQMQIQQQQQSIVPVAPGTAAGMRPLSQPPHFQQQQQQQQQQHQQQQASLQDRVNAILFSPMIGLGGLGLSGTFNDAASSDVKLTLVGRDGFSVTANVHTRVLIGSSRYFAAKLSDRSWVLKQPQRAPYSVEISDCEDVELYLLTIRLMYYSSSSSSSSVGGGGGRGSSPPDLKRVLTRENVSRVLGILKVASAIVFEAAVMACLDYLEAVPWSEEEEDKVLSLVSQLRPDYPAACRDVLKRLMESVLEEQPESVLVRLLHCVIKATDDKARREMKALVSKLLRENAAAAACSNSVIDVSKESLYEACRGCLDGLAECFARASDQGTGSIARHVDNLQWLADILIDRGLAEELVHMWAHQSQLAQLHGSLPAMQRHDASRITARLCVGIGRGQIMAAQEVRGMLLRTWLHPLMDDFAWMQRLASKSGAGGSGLDRRSVEEGICHTILTLALEEQRGILMAWLERYARDGDDCPNLQRAFEVWWRRTFVAGTARQQNLLA